MRQELTQGIANSAGTLLVGTGVATGILDYFSNNAAGIGAICTLGFGIIYVYFQWSSNKKLSVAEVNEIKIACVIEELEDHKEESTTRFDSIDIKLNSIISRLG